jgi:hypothetical protein
MKRIIAISLAILMALAITIFSPSADAATCKIIPKKKWEKQCTRNCKNRDNDTNCLKSCLDRVDQQCTD